MAATTALRTRRTAAAAAAAAAFGLAGIAVGTIAVVGPSQPIVAPLATDAGDSTATGGVGATGEAGPAATTGAQARTFTVAELAAGHVSPAQFDAFWQAELERIRTAPCPGPGAAGGTAVVATAGATPPAHLGDAYRDYAPRLAEAHEQAAARCR